MNLPPSESGEPSGPTHAPPPRPEPKFEFNADGVPEALRASPCPRYFAASEQGLVQGGAVKNTKRKARHWPPLIASCGCGPTERLVLYAMAVFIDWETGETRASVETIASAAGLSVETVRRKLRTLAASALIDEINRSAGGIQAGGRGLTSTYSLAPLLKFEKPNPRGASGPTRADSATKPGRTMPTTRADSAANPGSPPDNLSSSMKRSGGWSDAPPAHADVHEIPRGTWDPAAALKAAGVTP